MTIPRRHFLQGLAAATGVALHQLWWRHRRDEPESTASRPRPAVRVHAAWWHIQTARLTAASINRNTGFTGTIATLLDDDDGTYLEAVNPDGTQQLVVESNVRTDDLYGLLTFSVRLSNPAAGAVDTQAFVELLADGGVTVLASAGIGPLSATPTDYPIIAPASTIGGKYWAQITVDTTTPDGADLLDEAGSRLLDEVNDPVTEEA